MRHWCIYCGKELSIWERNLGYCTMCDKAKDQEYVDDMYYNDMYVYDPYTTQRIIRLNTDFL